MLRCLQVQLDIRAGHAITVDKVLNWMREDGSLQGVTVADAGCGTGSLSTPLALEGARVSGSDISEAMVRPLKPLWCVVKHALHAGSASGSVQALLPQPACQEVQGH